MEHSSAARRRRRRFDDEDDVPFESLTDRRRRPAPITALADTALAEPREDEPEPNWSSWGDAQHGPEPYPDWVITSLNAVDTELGVLKTGKEADVFLVERSLDQDGAAPVTSLLAAKRYRSSEHRLFHRDAGYLEGRRVRRSRETRAMARRTEFGRDLIAGQWAMAEFQALSRLWHLTGGGIGEATDAQTRALVPYPVQLRGREVLLEFIGEDDGTAAPRLAQTRPDPDELVALWHQLLDALGTLALAGVAHGDLSAYNVLVHRGRLVLIDLPQVVDIVGNPQGPQFLARDVRTIATWFTGRGLSPELADPDRLTRQLLADAGLHT